MRVKPAAEATFEDVGEAIADVDRVIAVFNALLRLADIDSGSRLSGFRNIQIREVAAEVAELYGPVAEEKSISLELDVPLGLEVYGDPFLLAQAVGNLIDNAVKFCPSGSIVKVSAGCDGENTIQITVSDNGPGIDEEEKLLVTERFYRGRTSHGTGGFGLGLSLVAAVARLHGGRLRFCDGKPGLIASITLPVSGQEF